jgi:hypothetical protein
MKHFDHLPGKIPVELAPFPFGRLPQLHRAIPSAALDDVRMYNYI